MGGGSPRWFISRRPSLAGFHTAKVCNYLKVTKSQVFTHYKNRRNHLSSQCQAYRMRAPCSGSQLWWTGVNGLDLGGNPASLPASPPSTIHSVPSMVPSQFVFQKAGTARAFVTGTVLCTVNRHRGEPGHTHGTHGRTRAHGSYRRTSQPSKPTTHEHTRTTIQTHEHTRTTHSTGYRCGSPLCLFTGTPVTRAAAARQGGRSSAR